VTEWQRLTGSQRVVMREAIDGQTFVDILNWSTPPADAPFWNRKWKYVEGAVAATDSLLGLGYIEVYDLEASPDATIPMPVGAAHEAVMDPANWWGYDEDSVDPDDVESGEDEHARERGRGLGTFHEFFVYASEAGFAMVRARGDDVSIYD
jgi:hypothetical protein